MRMGHKSCIELILDKSLLIIPLESVALGVFHLLLRLFRT